MVRKGMKICLLSNALSIHTRRWAGLLVDKGAQVHLISFRKGRPLPESETYVFEPKFNNAFCKLIYFAYNMKQVKKLILEINPDVLHAHYLTNYGLAGTLSGYKPLVVSTWGSDLLVDANKSFLHKQLIRCVLKRADLVTIMAEHMRDALLQLGCRPNKIMKVSLGIDLSQFNIYGKSKDTNDDCLMVGVRAFEKEQNNEHIIDAMVYLAKSTGKVKLHFYGDGSRLDACRERVGRLSLRKDIRFLGKVAHKDIPSIYRNADIYVSASTSDGDHVSLMEAMACGLFPVVSDIPANREWIKDGENGFLSSLHHPKDLADTIRRAMEDRHLREKAMFHNFELIKAKALYGSDVDKLIQSYHRLVAIEQKGV
jgi:glycosyltransferase involved in cell wall biosynthesis